MDFDQRKKISNPDNKCVTCFLRKLQFKETLLIYFNFCTITFGELLFWTSFCQSSQNSPSTHQTGRHFGLRVCNLAATPRGLSPGPPGNDTAVGVGRSRSFAKFTKFQGRIFNAAPKVGKLNKGRIIFYEEGRSVDFHFGF